MRHPLLLVVWAVVFLSAAPRLDAQSAPRLPLEQFIQQVAWLWNVSDVGSLVDLLPDDQRVLLDTGSGSEAVNARHAAAALRNLFEGRENVGTRAVQVTISGGSPPRGFAQLAWAYRTRGASAPMSRSVYVAALWDGTAWRISELRVMR